MNSKQRTTMRASAKYISLLGVSATLLAACGYDNGSDHHYVDSSIQDNPIIYSATIDADATMTNLNPGQGVGMMIEYGSGGTWYVKFTCDTSKTNLPCLWSIDAQSLDGSSLGGVDVQQLDSEDAVTPQPKKPYSLMYDGITTTELDSFSFQADAGKPIGFDVWLQDEYEPNRFVFWIGDGWLNKGISGPSFDLYPNSP
jgi:hypothetical protein